MCKTEPTQIASLSCLLVLEGEPKPNSSGNRPESFQPTLTEIVHKHRDGGDVWTPQSLPSQEVLRDSNTWSEGILED